MLNNIITLVVWQFPENKMGHANIRNFLEYSDYRGCKDFYKFLNSPSGNDYISSAIKIFILQRIPVEIDGFFSGVS